MLSLALIVSVVVVFSDNRSFSPQEPEGADYYDQRIWVHLNPKCFATETAVRSFKDYLVDKYECISFDEKKRQYIYKHPVSSNYSVWSLWLEKEDDLSCLDTQISLPSTVISSCIDGVYYEPLEHVHFDQCSDQSVDADLWSLDILDGLNNNNYYYPVFETNGDVESIILDTAVYAEHVEFTDYEPVSLFTGSLNPSTSYDHGTHVAGTVTGHDMGGAKTTATSYYPTCQLGNSCAWSDIEQGYETAISYMQAGPSGKRYVINYSVGGSRTTFNEAAYTDWGIRITNADGIWVTSAGNNNANACNYAPAFSQWAVTVGAYNKPQTGWERAWFSNYGSCTDTWAPGVEVLSSLPGNSYGYYSGTSMASPNIAALTINLLKNDPSMTLAQIKDYFNTNARFVSGPLGTMNQAYLVCG